MLLMVPLDVLFSKSLRQLLSTSVVQMPYGIFVNPVSETRLSGALPLHSEPDSGGFT